MWMPLIREILINMCVVILCQPGCDVINFELNLIFLIKLFFLHVQKIKTKKLGILRTKSAFKMDLKAFFIIFEGYH